MCGAKSVLVLALVVRLACCWDIAVTAGDRIEFYNADGIKTDTKDLRGQNLTALIYDEFYNRLLYVNKQSNNDSICSYGITSRKHMCSERMGRNIQDLDYDPFTNTLFITDTKEKSILSWSFKSGSKNKNKTFGNLIKMEEGIPTAIVVDSCRGYIYWINTNLTRSTIERARLNGSEREVLIKATNSWDLHSLAIDRLTQKIYWIEPQNTAESQVYSADLNGKNWKSVIEFIYSFQNTFVFTHPNTLTVSKENLFLMCDWRTFGEKNVWKHTKSSWQTEKLFQVDTTRYIGIAANYNMKDQYQDIWNCSNIINNYEILNLFVQHKCVHGDIVEGQFLCKCSPGYIGERCDVTVCENYCAQGNCSLTEEGLPKCRCNAGYSGERCEVNVCNGYCLQGNCSFTEEGIPKCRCDAGYSGERCEVDVCNGYCLNLGTCSLNEEDDPVCECVGAYVGQRCEVPAGLNNGDGSPNEEFETTCQCGRSHEGSGRNAGTKRTISSTSSCYLGDIDRNLTLCDLLDNWHNSAQ